MIRKLIAILRFGLSVVLGERGSSEYTYFPFDIRLPLPESAKLVMATLCRELEKLELNYRVTDGTVLGLYREGQFISHDNDIDIDVLDCDNVDKIFKLMSHHGMRLGRFVKFQNKTHQLAFYNEQKVIFDIIFWYSEGDKIVNHSEPGFIRKQARMYFENLPRLEWDGFSYPVPSNLDEWLAFRYGDDWREPKTFKGDWREECGDIEPFK